MKQSALKVAMVSDPIDARVTIGVPQLSFGENHNINAMQCNAKRSRSGCGENEDPRKLRPKNRKRRPLHGSRHALWLYQRKPVERLTTSLFAA